MTDKPKAIVVDLDNTLALLNGQRSPYDGHLCHTDELCDITAKVVGGFRLSHYIIVLTGRNETARDATERWLALHQIVYDDLLMRDPRDWRPAAEYKTVMLQRFILPDYEVDLVLDDDPKIVRAVRDLGLRCWWVNDYIPHEKDPTDDDD